MAEENKVEDILRKLGGEEVPADAQRIAAETIKSFRKDVEQGGFESTNLHGGRRMLITGRFSGVAAAAIVFLAFLIGVGTGRWSKSGAIPAKSQSIDVSNLPRVKRVAYAVEDAEESFWRAKAIASLRPKPYRGPKTYENKIGLWESYGKYMKEKYYE
jgi:hypothetical protein